MKKTLGLVFTLALAGCGTNHDADFHQALDQRVDEITDLRQHYRQATLDPSFDAIRDKVVLSESYRKVGPICSGSIDNSYPTPAEQAALRRWVAQRSDFLVKLAALTKPVKYESDRFTRMGERFDRLKFEEAAKVTAKLTDLSQGRLTYCEFANASREINREAHKTADAFISQIKEEKVLDLKRREGYTPVDEVWTSEYADHPR
jgi:Tfp pilus assembly protein PilP